METRIKLEKIIGKNKNNIFRYYTLCVSDRYFKQILIKKGKP